MELRVIPPEFLGLLIIQSEFLELSIILIEFLEISITLARPLQRVKSLGFLTDHLKIVMLRPH
jgi:hypothetical protein